jgi:hypothetical protein
MGGGGRGYHGGNLNLSNLFKKNPVSNAVQQANKNIYQPSAYGRLSQRNGNTNAPKGMKLTYDAASKSWTTPSGLIYGQGSKHGNRVMHVLDHATVNLKKKMHSVFNVDRSKVLRLVDEAWIKRGSPLTGDAGAYIIPMGRTVGTAGETSIKIVVRPGTSEVITAFPFK